MIQHFDLSEDERVSAAWDAYLCQNLMARFVTSQELGLEREMFELLWAHRTDISYGDNAGFMVGRDSVKRLWVDGREAMRRADQVLAAKLHPDTPSPPGAGAMERHNLMSPLVEVARDGKSAKGMWYCPGVRTQTEADGHPHLTWHYVRYGADFISEDGQWRIWHLFEGSEFAFEMGHSYIPATGMNPLPDATAYPQAPETAGLPLGREIFPARDIQVKTYSIAYGWSPYPAVPVPYETFDETFTYGPEPFAGSV